MDYQYIEATLSNGIATITLNRPPLNILNMAMMDEINRELSALSEKRVKILVLKAKGKAFCAGVDVGEHMGKSAKGMLASFHAIFRSLEKLGVPSVSVVKGAAIGGGCELAVGCDMVIASEASTFGQPEIRVGVFPPVACLLFPRLMGMKRAMELILSGEIIGALDAEAAGLVSRVAAENKLDAVAKEFIDKLAGNSGVVMRLAREAILRGPGENGERVLKEIEEIYLERLMKTRDAAEGLQAFLERRKPDWKEC